MTKSIKTKRVLKRAVSIVLALAMVFPTIFSSASVFGEFSGALLASASYEGSAVRTFIPNDPLAHMVDIPVERYEPEAVADDGVSEYLLAEFYLENAELAYEMYYGLEQYEGRAARARGAELTDEMYYEVEQHEEEEYEDGRTDRFIVRYRPGRRESFQRALSAQIASSEALSVAVDMAVSSDVGRGIAAAGEMHLNGVGHAAITGGWEVLRLNERMLPSEFAEIIRNSAAIHDIEHIQPDFALQLANVDDAVDDDIALDDAIDDDIALDDAIDDDVALDDAIDDDIALDDAIDEKLLAPQDDNLRRPSAASAVTVAVIDTGIDSTHRMLSSHMLPGWNFTNNTSFTYDPSHPLASAHGTHIAGIIAGAALEAGVNVQILPLQVFDNGRAYTSNVIAAIEYAVIRGASIVNVSFGSTQSNPALKEALANADALFVCAVGNHRRDFMAQPSYPAGYNLPNVISVASVNADGGFSFFSNYGVNIDIAALGRDVLSTFPENEYGLLTGTSMSAAYVTAVAAIVSANEVLSASELRERLISTGDRLSNLQGKVNEGRRVSLANAVSNVRPTSITENHPEDDFSVHGLQLSDDEAWELFSAVGTHQAISAGNNFSLALRSDGTVWSWGNGGNGRLGHGTGSTANIGTPRQVHGLTNVISISAGTSHALALRSDGRVWAWGNNGSGRLGDGTTTSRHAPVQTTSGLLSPALSITPLRLLLRLAQHM